MMATLATISYLIAAAIFIYTLVKTGPDLSILPSGSGFFMNLHVLGFLFIGGIGLWIATLISHSIFLDIYGIKPNAIDLSSPEGIRYSAISGLVTLSLSSLLSYAFGTLTQTSIKQKESLSKPKRILMKVRIIEIITFLSSVLGIIGFYLDHLK